MHAAAGHLLPLPRPARDDHDVGVRNVAERGVGMQRQHPGVGAHQAGLPGREDHGGTGQPGQHLIGPDGVESGEPVVQQDDDLHGTSPPVGGQQ